MADTQVKKNDSDNRFEILVDGSVVGYAQYEEKDNGVRDFNHTVVDEDHRGEGLSSTLIAEALDATRAEDKKILATCPAVDHFVKTHEDYKDLLAQ